MTASMKRIVLWSVPATVLVVVLAMLLRPRAELVDVVQVQMAPMLVTIDEEGETRTREVFTISAPVGGRLLRTSLREGDLVVANQTPVAQIEPSEPEFLDPRSQAQGEATRDAASAALALAAAELKQAEAERDFATAEVQRFHELFSKGTVPKQQVEDAERAAQSTLAAVEAAQAGLSVRHFELNRAEASLITPAGAHEAHGAWCECVTVRSPVDGRVLRVHHKSETIVSPGTPLIEVGDPHDLEIVADYLSIDAVKIQAGQPAFIDGWGQDVRLQAVVQRVEPYAVMKVSALGIEEQRVNVILDIIDPVEKWATLGHGYRVESRIIAWQADAVKTVPLTALFRQGRDWAVFVDDDKTAVLRMVEIGHTAGLTVEITDGLEIGEWVVMHPNDRLDDGSRLRRRGGG
jgi:HlyD family secretion protein